MLPRSLIIPALASAVLQGCQSKDCTEAPSLHGEEIEGNTISNNAYCDEVAAGRLGVEYEFRTLIYNEEGTLEFEWTVPADAEIVDGQGTQLLHVDVGYESGEICIQKHNACGRSEIGCQPLNIVESYTMTERGPFPKVPTEVPRVTTLDGIGYAALGSSTGGGNGVIDLWSFDPTTETWSAMPPIQGLGAVWIAGAGDKVALLTTENETWVLDPTSGAWSPGMPFPLELMHSLTFAIGSKIYMPGGPAPYNAITDTVWAFDTATSQWSESTPLPVPWSAAGAFAVGGFGYILGGSRDGLQTDEVLRYDSESEAWSAVAPMDCGAMFQPLATWGSAGRGYAWDEEAHLCEYDPGTDSWSEPTPDLGCPTEIPYLWIDTAPMAFDDRAFLVAALEDRTNNFWEWTDRVFRFLLTGVGE